MKITNKAASQLTKGQEIILTEELSIFSQENIQKLKVISIRKSNKYKCGLRVWVEAIKGSLTGSKMVIVNFEYPGRVYTI